MKLSTIKPYKFARKAHKNGKVHVVCVEIKRKHKGKKPMITASS